jgi:hypothetical protein
MSDPSHKAASAPKGSPTLRQALLLLAAIIVLVSVFIALCSGLGIVDLFPGFFFLYHWGSIEQGKLSALRSVIPGAFFGLGLGWLLLVLSGSLLGLSIFIAGLLPVILCQILGRFPLVINTATMLFLTFSTIAHVQAHASFPGMFAGLAVAIALFVPVVALAGRLNR